jgi:hypothetical protein
LTFTAFQIGKDQRAMERWQEYVARSPDATIYHDLAWREIFGVALRYRSFHLMVEDAAGRVRGILPLFRVPSLMGKPRLVAVPFRDRGGIVANNAEAFACLVTTAIKLANDKGCSFVEIKSLRPYPPGWGGDMMRRRDYWVHSEIALPASVDEFRRNLGPKRRNMIRQARRAGLGVERMTSIESIHTWYSLYQASQKNLGVPPFPLSFFQEMARLLLPADKLELYVTRDADRGVIAACILFREPARVIYGYSASMPGSRGLRPNDVMLDTIVTECIRQAVPVFDMGADSPNQEGLLFFKRGWGASQRSLPFYYLGNGDPVARDSSDAGFGLARRIVSHVPTFIARHILAPATRYFG